MIILNTKHIIKHNDIKSLCLGHFDGFHIAHQKIFDLLDSNGAILVIGIENSILTPSDFRDSFIKQAIFGFHLSDIKHLGAKDFFLRLKDFFPNFNQLIVGYDFKMGKDRECGLDCLKKEFKNISIKVINEIKVDGISVHSSIIKDMIKKGDIKKANKLLGRKYCIVGDIVSGQGIGSKELVPTINVSNNNNFLLPHNGVYVTKVNINNQDILSISFIGKRTSTDNNFAIETHILDSDFELNNAKTLKISFYEKIRDNIHFNSKYLLREQIIKDIALARKINE